MILDIPTGPSIDNTETIWRYMDFASFYSLLLTKGLFFKRLDKYTDEYEGTIPDETREALLKHRSGFPFTTHQEANDWVNNYIANVETYKVGTLSNSWILSKAENYAMWKIYPSPNILLPFSLPMMILCTMNNSFSLLNEGMPGG